MKRAGKQLRAAPPERGGEKGSMLALTIVSIALIVVPLFMVLAYTGVSLVARQRAQSIVEAAGLIAANDISRIIFNDPTFGYVSLSNHPPTGKATRAPDGEPLPVIGINTLVGTIRQNAIIGRQLRNQTIMSLAENDRVSLGKTIDELNSILNDSLSGAVTYVDIDGEVVDPLEDVTAFLNANLPKNLKLESVSLANGWLARGSTTTIPVPQPNQIAQVSSEDSQGGNYKAFIDVPVTNRSFSFAGLGTASSIVPSAEFRESDTEHICSIVRIECVFVVKDLPLLPFGLTPSSQFNCFACSQPCTQPDVATKGGMTLKLSGGSVPGLQSWSDFLKTDNFNDNQVIAYDIIGGDYPVDQDARMRQIPGQVPSSTAKQFAEHLYYWLRNGRLQPRIDAVLAMMNEPFRCGPNEMYTYEFAKDGKIARRTVFRDPLLVGVTADAQYSVVADTNLAGGITPVIVFRDNVKYLGTKTGGKHGGQPLAGYPLAGPDLQQYSGDNKKLSIRLSKRSIYRSGLALDIEIGGVQQQVETFDPSSMNRPIPNRRI